MIKHFLKWNSSAAPSETHTPWGKWFVVAAALCTVAALAAAGCGGGGKGGSGYTVRADTTLTTASLSKQQFRTDVNRICQEAWPVIASNWREYSGTPQPPTNKKPGFEKSVRLSLLAGIDFHIFDEIYRLGAPGGEQARAEALIGSMQSAVERGQKNLVPVSSLPQVVTLFGDFNRRAGQYGLDNCLVDPQHLSFARS